MELTFWRKKEARSPVIEEVAHEAVQAEEAVAEATRTFCQRLTDTWHHYTTVACPEFWARQRDRCCPPPARGIVVDTEGTTAVVAPSAAEPVVVKKKTPVLEAPKEPLSKDEQEVALRTIADVQCPFPLCSFAEDQPPPDADQFMREIAYLCGPGQEDFVQPAATCSIKSSPYKPPAMTVPETKASKKRPRKISMKPETPFLDSRRESVCEQVALCLGPAMVASDEAALLQLLGKDKIPSEDAVAFLLTHFEGKLEDASPLYLSCYYLLVLHVVRHSFSTVCEVSQLGCEIEQALLFFKEHAQMVSPLLAALLSDLVVESIFGESEALNMESPPPLEQATRVFCSLSAAYNRFPESRQTIMDEFLRVPHADSGKVLVHSATLSAKTLYALALIQSFSFDISTSGAELSSALEVRLLPASSCAFRIVESQCTGSGGRASTAEELRLMLADALKLLCCSDLPASQVFVMQALAFAFSFVLAASEKDISAKSAFVDVIVDIANAANAAQLGLGLGLEVGRPAEFRKILSAQSACTCTGGHGPGWSGMSCTVFQKTAAILLRLLSHESASVRAKALKGIVQASSARCQAYLTDDLLNALSMDPSSAVREGALDCISKSMAACDEVLPKVVECIEDDSPAVRKKALRIRQQYSGKNGGALLAVAETLLRLCTSLDEAVSGTASSVLERYFASASEDPDRFAAVVVSFSEHARKKTSYAVALEKQLSKVALPRELFEKMVDQTDDGSRAASVLSALVLVPPVEVDTERLQAIYSHTNGGSELASPALQVLARLIPLCPLMSLHALEAFELRMISILLKAPEHMLKAAMECLYLYIFHCSSRSDYLSSLWNKFFSFVKDRQPSTNGPPDDATMHSLCRAIYVLGIMCRISKSDSSRCASLLDVLVGMFRGGAPLVSSYVVGAICVLWELDRGTIEVAGVFPIIMETVAGSDYRAIGDVLRGLQAHLPHSTADPKLAQLRNAVMELCVSPPRGLHPALVRVVSFIYSACMAHPKELLSPLLYLAGSPFSECGHEAKEVFRRMLERFPVFYAGNFYEIWACVYAEDVCNAVESRPIGCSLAIMQFYLDCIRGRQSLRIEFLRAGVRHVLEGEHPVLYCSLLSELQLDSGEELKRLRAHLDKAVSPLLSPNNLEEGELRRLALLATLAHQLSRQPEGRAKLEPFNALMRSSHSDLVSYVEQTFV